MTGALGGARGWFSRADAFSSPPDEWEPTGSVGRGETTGKLKREGRGRRRHRWTEEDGRTRREMPSRASGLPGKAVFFLPWFSECCLGPS